MSAYDEIRCGCLSLVIEPLNKLSWACGPQVLDMIIDDIDIDRTGAVNYGSFVSALRQNKLQYKPYNEKLRHRTKGDVDQPFGPTMLSAPWGTANDVAGNEATLAAVADGEIDEFRRAFRAADEDNDGVVNYEQFVRALKVSLDGYGIKFQGRGFKEGEGSNGLTSENSRSLDLVAESDVWYAEE